MPVDVPPSLTLALRAEASSAIGYGHMMRSGTVLRALRALMAGRGESLRVLGIAPCASDMAALRDRVDDVITFDDGDWITRLREIHRPQDGPLLIDSYDITQEQLHALQEIGYTTIVFADGAVLPCYPVQMLIDAAPAAEARGYHAAAETQRCFGLRWFPLRPAFVAARKFRLNRPLGAPPRLLITCGGSDPDDATARLLRAVLDDEALAASPMDVVLGPGYRGDARDEFGDKCRLTWRNAPSGDEVAGIFAAADIAIASAGGTALELAALGVPSVLVTLSPDQHGIATGLAGAGAAIALGLVEHVDDARLRGAVRQLAEDPRRRAAMSAVGPQLVDGGGGARLADAILQAWTRRQPDVLSPPDDRADPALTGRSLPMQK